MNEIVKNICEKSKEYSDEMVKELNDNPEVPLSYMDFYTEKFAELIIEHVCKELRESKNCDIYTGELYDCERNTVLDEQINWLQFIFGLSDEP